MGYIGPGRSQPSYVVFFRKDNLVGPVKNSKYMGLCSKLDAKDQFCFGLLGGKKLKIGENRKD